MKILIMCSVLEMAGLYLSFSPIVKYIMDRRCYNEYSNNIDVLIEEMRDDELTLQEDKERLIMIMDEQIKFSKMNAILGAIGMIIMGAFLVNTFLQIINL